MLSVKNGKMIRAWFLPPETLQSVVIRNSSSKAAQSCVWVLLCSKHEQNHSVFVDLVLLLKGLFDQGHVPRKDWNQGCCRSQPPQWHLRWRGGGIISKKLKGYIRGWKWQCECRMSAISVQQMNSLKRLTLWFRNALSISRTWMQEGSPEGWGENCLLIPQRPQRTRPEHTLLYDADQKKRLHERQIQPFMLSFRKISSKF